MSPGLLYGLIAAGVLVVALLVYLLTSQGSGDDATNATTPPATAPTATTTVAPPLGANAPATVAIESGTSQSPRVHPLTLAAGQTGTVVVRANEPFTPVIQLFSADDAAVPLSGTSLGRRGAAVAVSAPAAGEYSLVVSGFSDRQQGYTIEFHPDEAFLAPEQLGLGDCVNRLDGEDWRSVSGFFVTSCDQPHEGQVFEQAAGGLSGQAAQDRCGEARHQRILIPGFVSWFAYWGADLTCVARGANGAMLTQSIVST